jgi:hypothetical protein
VHGRQLRQPLLRVAALGAELPEPRRQEFPRFLFGSQTSSVFCCRLLVYRILVTIEMQDRYAGDVGDFGKFGLLRHLCGTTATDTEPYLKPGVIWYKTTPGPAEQTKPDGEFAQYLQTASKKPRLYNECDALLFKALADIRIRDRTMVGCALKCGGGSTQMTSKSPSPELAWTASAFSRSVGSIWSQGRIVSRDQRSLA